MSCKNCVLAGKPPHLLWDQDHRKLMANLNACIHLSSTYRGQYSLTKAKLLAVPKGKQFDFSETRVWPVNLPAPAPAPAPLPPGSASRFWFGWCMQAGLLCWPVPADLRDPGRVLPPRGEAAGHVQHHPSVQDAEGAPVRGGDVP
jgi:hypothetical protein